jgi:ATP-dependent helicase/nuclease subunit B
MTIRREFIDWKPPALPAAANWLIDCACEQNATATSAQRKWCDLQSTVCILPGRRAGRILLGCLLRACQERGSQLVPPTVLTPGALTDFILATPGAIANQVEMELAWLAALQGAAREDLAALLPHLSERDDVLAWRSLAATTAQLHAELAGQRIDFEAVASQAERLERLNEGERWRVLHRLHNRYQSHMRTAGLIDPHAAREQAIAKLLSNQEIAPAPQIKNFMLIGVAELNQLHRTAVNLVRDRAVALVHAPAELAGHFDSHGCVETQRWSARMIDICDEQITIADRPADQAQQTLRAIARLDGAYSEGEITIGLGDPKLAPALQHAGEWAGTSMRSAEQRRLGQSPAVRALNAIGKWIDEPRFAMFANLLRHPDIERFLERHAPNAMRGRDNWLTLLDYYFTDFLHERITDRWLGDAKYRKQLGEAYAAVCRLVQPLASSRRKPLGNWAQPIVDVLNALYQGEARQPWDDRSQACQRITEILSEFAASASMLQPETTAAQAISMVIAHAEIEPSPEEIEPQQIEMLGWLELHLDPAPVLILTGVSEGNIPQSATADPVLPDSLRSKLGLACNASRYARDAYLLSAMNASRAHLHLVVGRRSSRGEPLTPSRLLLACDDRTLVRRIEQLCDEQGDGISSTPIGLRSSDSASRFKIPSVEQLIAQLESVCGSPWRGREYMNITEFRTYLECPYRYALKRLLKLECRDDRETELDGLRFGTLAHDVLCSFGNDAELNQSEDSDQIEKFLVRELYASVEKRFGDALLPAMRVQIARLEQRLRSFARLQARLAAEGWRIRHCELQFEKEIALELPDGDPMPLWGKIDRIDFNPQTGQWRIIDYKTSEAANTPCKTHHKREKLPDVGELEWHDLQLPLYHFLATRSKHGIQGDIELAYICLPKQTDGAAVKVAEWTQAHLDHAIERARQIVRDIRAGRFALNPEFDLSFDEFGRICQTAAFAEREPAETEA